LQLFLQIFHTYLFPFISTWYIFPFFPILFSPKRSLEALATGEDRLSEDRLGEDRFLRDLFLLDFLL
jgi:hypothetical protein